MNLGYGRLSTTAYGPPPKVHLFTVRSAVHLCRLPTLWRAWPGDMVIVLTRTQRSVVPARVRLWWSWLVNLLWGTRRDVDCAYALPPDGHRADRWGPEGDFSAEFLARAGRAFGSELPVSHHPKSLAR